MCLGGDEFIVFAPDVPAAYEAEPIISRIFKNIADAKVEELGSRRVTVSIGAALCPRGTVMSFADLYKQADNCVYVSKRQGGNLSTFCRSSDVSG